MKGRVTKELEKLKYFTLKIQEAATKLLWSWRESKTMCQTNQTY